jgi:hypothetical protein
MGLHHRRRSGTGREIGPRPTSTSQPHAMSDQSEGRPTGACARDNDQTPTEAICNICTRGIIMPRRFGCPAVRPHQGVKREVRWRRVPAHSAESGAAPATVNLTGPLHATALMRGKAADPRMTVSQKTGPR